MPELLTSTYGRNNWNNELSGKTNELVFSQELIEEFLTHLAEKGRTPETIATYRSFFKRICSFLPENMAITRNTLADIWEQMEREGFAANTINSSISAANSLLEYCDRLDLLTPLRTRDGVVNSPELTRVEYQRLLQTARDQGNERLYLLIKVFVCTGINTYELSRITAEAVRAEAVVMSGDITDSSEIHLPHCLCEELESYMEGHNIISGPVFVNQNGQILSRSIITRMIAALSDDAQVPREKCNVRSLQKLYQTTQKTIEKNIFLQRQQLHDYMIYQEQLIVGWKASSKQTVV